MAYNEAEKIIFSTLFGLITLGVGFSIRRIFRAYKKNSRLIHFSPRIIGCKTEIHINQEDFRNLPHIERLKQIEKHNFFDALIYSQLVRPVALLNYDLNDSFHGLYPISHEVKVAYDTDIKYLNDVFYLNHLEWFLYVRGKERLYFLTDPLDPISLLLTPYRNRFFYEKLVFDIFLICVFLFIGWAMFYTVEKLSV